MFGGTAFWQASRKHDLEVVLTFDNFAVETYGALEIQRWTEAAGQACLRIYRGKAGKPIENCVAAAGKERVLDELVQRHKAAEDARVQWKAGKKALQAVDNTMRVGDILTYSWGYEQTNVNFFEVVAVAGKTVTIREIAQCATETGFMCGETVPRPGEFIGALMVKRVVGQKNADGTQSLWLTMPHGAATPWDGKPERFSSYA